MKETKHVFPRRYVNSCAEDTCYDLVGMRDRVLTQIKKRVRDIKLY